MRRNKIPDGKDSSRCLVASSISIVFLFVCRKNVWKSLLNNKRKKHLLFVSLENRCRSSTYDLQNPQCPICQVPLNGQDLSTHIQHELDHIERNRQQSKYSTRRSTHLTNNPSKVSSHLLSTDK